MRTNKSPTASSSPKLSIACICLIADCNVHSAGARFFKDKTYNSIIDLSVSYI